MQVPYIVYADFECALTPFHQVSHDPTLAESYTTKRHHHTPTSWSYYIVNHNEADDRGNQFAQYRGPNAVRHFWNGLQKDLQEIDEIYSKIVPINPVDAGNFLFQE